jgi:heme exporter protein C
MLRYANPARYMALSAWAMPVMAAAAAILIGIGLWQALFMVPPDYQQGETVRIMYVHVPAAWAAMAGYVFIALAHAVGFIWKHPLADAAARSAAPAGAVFCLLCLITGSLWGAPMWGTWWAWDPRLVSVLILFLLYLGYIALWEAIEDPAKAAKAAGVLALVGAVNIPVIRFSVDWWNSLHQPASVIRIEDGQLDPSIHASMLWPLLVMGVGYLCLFGALTMLRLRTEIHLRRARTLMLSRGAA